MIEANYIYMVKKYFKFDNNIVIGRVLEGRKIVGIKIADINTFQTYFVTEKNDSCFCITY